MNNSEKKDILEFWDRLASLYADIQTWIESHNLQAIRSIIQLNEEAYGSYTADKLSIFDKEGIKIGDVLPIGASVIGAMGRVDLIGNIDQEILVYLHSVQCITTQVTTGNHEKHTSLYRGVNGPGWYWIESRKLSRARKLDESLFLDLLTGISDYDCR